MKKPLRITLLVVLGLAASGFAFNGVRVWHTIETAKAIPIGLDSAQLISIMGAPHRVELRAANVDYPTYTKVSYSTSLFLPNTCDFEINEGGKIHSSHTEVAVVGLKKSGE